MCPEYVLLMSHSPKFEHMLLYDQRVSDPQLSVIRNSPNDVRMILNT